jgi:DNA-binding response OmpR family regulator
MAGRVLVLFCEEYARGAFVSQALSDAGYAVKWVRGVETAHQLAERQRVDVLVADARSDDLLGWLVGGWRRRTPASPVVLLARANDGASAPLADEVVSSPLTVESIRRSVERVLRERASA